MSPPTDERRKRRWAGRLQNKLARGNIRSLVQQLRSFHPDNPEAAELLQTEADYFDRNRPRMRYPAFRRDHLFVGSGVIEAACKTVIGSRLKRSGMRHARKRVLDCPRGQRRHCPSVLSLQPSIRRLLGVAPGMIAHPVSRTRRA
jgi:hypothetical protein